MDDLTFFVPTLFGLEGVCAGELRRMELRSVRAENGRVLFDGDARALVRASINLRTGERVLLRLGSFPCESFDQLYEGVRALPWEDFIPRDGAFPVKGHCLDSRLHAEVNCIRNVQGAVGARLERAYGLNRMPQTGAVYQVRYRLFKDVAELYLDASGPALHKRGYRALGVAAPLRETLAAGLVLLSGYRGKGPFRDPFCGSGTIPIEAAMIAKNRAPGLNRRHSAQSWGWVPPKLWEEETRRATALEFSGVYDVFGSDIDEKAVLLAKENAAKSGINDIVRFDVADAARFSPTEPWGTVVTNPPYGERLNDKKEAEKIYAAFGRAWKNVPSGWGLYLLSSHTEFERTFGKKAEKRRKLYNGTLKCDLFQYPGKRGESA